MARTAIKGDEIMMFMDGHSLAWATNHVLTLSSETEEVSTKDHGSFSSTEVVKINWEITSDCIYTETNDGDGYENLRDAMLLMQPVDVVWGRASNYDRNGNQRVDDSNTEEEWIAQTSQTKKYFGGKVIITNLQLNAQSGSNSTFSCTMTGAGPFKEVTVS